METTVIETIFETNTLTGDELVELMAMKDEFPREAELAFTEFCFRYESDIFKKSEIWCLKWGYSEVEAEQIANCAFARVWKYPTFRICKAKSKDVDKAIMLWLYRIAYTQLLLTLRKGTCVEPTEEEDLSLITNIEDFVSTFTDIDREEQSDNLLHGLEILNAAMQGLSEKHRVIYLTYKAYRPKGYNIPRSVSKKLREQLDLTQNSIGVYKMQAEQQIKQYLSHRHENK